MAGSRGEKRFWPLKERWFWILFGVLVAVLIVPFLIVGVIVMLVPASNLLGALIYILIVAAVIWLVLKGYRDWTEGKKKKQKREKYPENVSSFPLLSSPCSLWTFFSEDPTETIFHND